MSPGPSPSFVAVHGHFYQPPREDPWLDLVPRELSAAPWHDWNERIERECYRAVTAARLQDARGRITGIINLLEWISFNVGATLLEWMERQAPATYTRILEADRRAILRTGWGTAIAQPYHHVILPLASPRDRRTEIRWGIADFRRRFGREPLGMWLPETAVDHATLDDLAAAGIAFTIVGDHQVASPPAGGRPGWIRTTGGRRIAVFCYDGPISHDVAFGPLLRDAGAWERRLLEAPPARPTGAVPPDPAPEENGAAPREVGAGGAGDHLEGVAAPVGRDAAGGSPLHPRELVLVATDGETFGHHHAFGEMALAALVDRLRVRPGVRVDPLAAVLEKLPPREELELRSPSSWSCAHGVDRWRAECGCRMTPGTQQEWRAPLRRAVEVTAEHLHGRFESEATALGLEDPWGLRDALGPVAGAGAEAWREGVDRALPSTVPDQHRVRIRELLEMERDILRSFTSCGWFFDDIAGLEGLQVLRYLARALELAGTGVQAELEPRVLGILERADSNDADRGTGARLYREEVLPRVPAPARVAAGVAAVAAVSNDTPSSCDPSNDLDAWTGRAIGEVTAPGETPVEVIHRRTGRSSRWQVSVRRLDEGRVVAEVGPDGPAPRWVIPSAELPEPHATAVASALRRSLVVRWLTAADHAALLAGDVSLGHLAAQRLVEELERLHGGDREAVAAALAPVTALAELAELAGAHVPFDLQTALHRLRRTLDPGAAAVLEPLASLLGFAPESD